MFKSTLFLLGSLLSVAVATPLASRALPSGPVTCGNNVYTVSQVVSAVSNGVNHLDNPIGSNSYPHRFNNREGLSMWCTGKTLFNEFPILRSGAYTGGDPGADRVVFSDDGVYCAVITHTGASGNNFVSCEGD
ncbi:Ribonuclease/ribotoxin [Marasmius fiardii PR-910]|nr:Ribonuclease/ribotoxin [Marasmius fiardii PR-910]